MRRYFILSVISALFLLSGCERIAEPNDLLYVVAVGVDKGEKAEYKFTLQYAKVFEINSSEGGGDGDIVENLTVEAPGLYSAVDIGNHLVSKRFTLSHLKLAVFSREVAEEGIGEFVEIMSRSRDIRPDVYISVAEKSGEEYLKGIKPSNEVNPSKYYELIYDNVYSEYIPKTTNEEMYKSISGGGRDMTAAIAGEAADSIDGEIIESGYEYGVMRMGGDKQDGSGVMGMGVFSGDKLVLTCSNDEVKLYNILMNKFEYGYITFYNNNEPSIPITLRIEENKDTDYKITVSEDKITLDADIYMEAEFSGLPQDYDHEKHIEEYEEEIEGYMEEAAVEFLNKVYAAKCDILDVKGMARTKFLTYDEYESYDAASKAVDFNINADIKIRRAGMTVRE